MRKLSIFLIVTWIIFLSACQKENKTAHFAVVGMDNIRLLYYSIDNPVSILVSGVSPEKVSISMDKGTINQLESPGTYLVTIPAPESDSVLTEQVNFFISYGDQTDTISGVVRRVPNPSPFFGSKSSGEISSDEVKLVNFISVRLENFPFDISFKTTKYTFIFQPRKGPALLFKSSGPDLTPEMKEVLEKAAKGDMIIISDVYTSMANEDERRIPGACVLTVQ